MTADHVGTGSEDILVWPEGRLDVSESDLVLPVPLGYC